MKIRDLVIEVRLRADKVAKGLKSLDRGARKTAEGFNTMRDANGRLRDSMGRFVKEGESANGILGKLSVSLGGLANVAASAATAIGGAMVDATKDAIKFESAMADVAKVVPGLRDESGKATAEFDAMKKSIFGLSSEIAIAPEGFAKIIAAAGQAGIAREELERFASDAAKMAVAFDTNADKAGEAMAKMRTGLGLSQDEVYQLAGQFNYLGQNMAVTGGELVDVTKRVGAMAKGAGLGTDQMGALAATMIASGAKTSVAATGIKNFSLALAAGDAATNRQRVAYEKLGLVPEEVAKNFTAGGKKTEETIKGVLESIKGLDKAEQSATLMQLFGKESIGAIAPMLENMDKLDQAFGLVADKQTALNSINKEYETRAATTENALQILSNRAEIASIRVGDALLPALNGLIGLVSSPEAGAMADNLLDGITSGIESLVEIGKEVASALAPIFSGIGDTVGGAFSGLKEGFSGVREALSPFLEALSKLGTLIFDVLGIAGDEGRAFGEETSKSFGETAVSAVETLTSAIEYMIEVIEMLKPILSPIVSFLKSSVGSTLERIGDIAKMAGDYIDGITDALRSFQAGNFAEGFSKLGHAILNALIEPLRIVARQLVDLADAVPGGSSMVPQSLREFAGKTALAGVLAKVQGAAGKAEAPAEEEPMMASRASMQGGNLSDARRKQMAQTPAEAHAEAVAELRARYSEATDPTERRHLRQALIDAGVHMPKGGRKGKKSRGRKEADFRGVEDADVLRTLYESPAQTRQRLRQEAAARKDLGKAGKQANALDAAIIDSVAKARTISGGSDRISSVGPSVTNMYNTFNIDARGAEGQVANIDRAGRRFARTANDTLRGVDTAAMRARGGGGSAAGAG